MEVLLILIENPLMTGDAYRAMNSAHTKLVDIILQMEADLYGKTERHYQYGDEDDS